MSGRNSIPATLEIIYEPAPSGGAWTGYCPSFPELRVDGTTIHQVDLKLVPVVTRALQARYVEGLAINVMPGGETPIDAGRYRKVLPVAPDNLPCTWRR